MGQTELLEKAKSRSQQRLMGMALAYKRGEMKDAPANVKKMADSMSEKDLEDYAKTKHDKIPEKVDEALTPVSSVLTCKIGNKTITKNMKVKAPRHEIERHLKKLDCGLSDAELMQASRDLSKNKAFSNGKVSLSVKLKYPDEMNESLSVGARRKKARQMKRMKAKLRIGRQKAKNRMPDADRISSRARRSARAELFKKISKGKGKSKLSYAQRKNIEKRIDKMKGRQDRITKKLKPVKRREAARR